MNVYKDAVLTCSTCGVEGEHELLYLSERLRASRCANCGKTQVYSGHIYTEYALDLAERTKNYAGKMAGNVLRGPAEIVRLPFKAIGKPLGLLRELHEISSFNRSRRSPTGGRTR